MEYRKDWKLFQRISHECVDIALDQKHLYHMLNQLVPGFVVLWPIVSIDFVYQYIFLTCKILFFFNEAL